MTHGHTIADIDTVKCDGVPIYHLLVCISVDVYPFALIPINN